MDRTPCYNTIALDRWLNEQDQAARKEAELEAEVQHEAAKLFARMHELDVSDTLCCDAMVEAVKTRNTDLIGRVALHLIEGVCKRIAENDVYECGSSDNSEAEAAQMVAEWKGAQQ